MLRASNHTLTHNILSLTHTHNTLSHTHTQPHVSSLIACFFALSFYLFQWFWQQTFAHGSSAKATPPWGYTMSHTATPPSLSPSPSHGLGAISGFVDCLTNCQQQRRLWRLWSKLFALQTLTHTQKRSVLCSDCHCCLVAPLSLSHTHTRSLPLSVTLGLLFCQALTSDARFPRHRWPVSKATLPIKCNTFTICPAPSFCPWGDGCTLSKSFETGNKKGNTNWNYAFVNSTTFSAHFNEKKEVEDSKINWVKYFY